MLSLLLCILLTFISHLTGRVNAKDTRIITLELQPTDIFCTPPSGSQATWYFNEEPIRNNSGPYQISTDRLTLIAPTLAEAGRYTCIDHDQTPTNLSAIDYIVIVESPPMITVAPSTLINVTSEGFVAFRCKALGSPPPDISWTVDNQNVSTFSNGTKGTSFLTVGIITPAVKLGTHKVTCLASNRHGNDTQSATFTVVDRRIDGTDSPIDYEADIGTLVTFNCSSQPLPPDSKIQWTKDGTALIETTPSFSMITTTADDTGVYCCSVNGTIVNCRYLFIPVRPFIDVVSPSISTVIGRNVSLYCHAMGEYSPNITWQFSNGTLIEDSTFTAISRTSLERSYLRLSNVFSEFQLSEIVCVATNGFGVMTRVINIASVGLCGKNILTDPNSANSQWQFPNLTTQTQASFTFHRGESVFQIGYSDLNIGQNTSAITHLVTVDSSVVKLHLRSQVRQDDPEPGYLPSICLISEAGEICTGLDTAFTDNPMGWQWVEIYVDLSTLEVSTIELSLFARGNTVSSRNGRVFFDNICLETFNEIPPPPPSSSSNNNIALIAGASAGGVVLLIIVVVLIVCCCLCSRKSTVKIVQFRKQGDATIRRSTGNIKMSQAVRYHNNPVKTQPVNQDNPDDAYNYITPNKVQLGYMTPTKSIAGSTDEIYTDSKGDYYIKLMADPTKEPNHYQVIKDEAIKLYESIQECEQPQYEALRGEANEPSQYLTVQSGNDSEQQPQYLAVVGDGTNDEIYSDISDTIEQVKQLQAQEDDQKSED